MQVIGFNFIKIQAERKAHLDQALAINTNIEFTNLEKEKLDLIKDKDPLKISFKFSIIYSKKEDKKEDEQAKLIFEGHMILMSEEEQTKELLKDWKKKQISQSFRLPLFNVILKRCSVKALQLEDELGLPNHMPIPQISPQSQSQNK